MEDVRRLKFLLPGVCMIRHQVMLSRFYYSTFERDDSQEQRGYVDESSWTLELR